MRLHSNTILIYIVTRLLIHGNAYCVPMTTLSVLVSVPTVREICRNKMHRSVSYIIHKSACLPHLASFPGPTQLSIACSTEKRGEPGIFSHVSMT